MKNEIHLDRGSAAPPMSSCWIAAILLALLQTGEIGYRSNAMLISKGHRGGFEGRRDRSARSGVAIKDHELRDIERPGPQDLRRGLPRRRPRMCCRH